jgi:hypothetical protein
MSDNSDENEELIEEPLEAPPIPIKPPSTTATTANDIAN